MLIVLPPCRYQRIWHLCAGRSQLSVRMGGTVMLQPYSQGGSRMKQGLPCT